MPVHLVSNFSALPVFDQKSLASLSPCGILIRRQLECHVNSVTLDSAFYILHWQRRHWRLNPLDMVHWMDDAADVVGNRSQDQRVAVNSLLVNYLCDY